MGAGTVSASVYRLLKSFWPLLGGGLLVWFLFWLWPAKRPEPPVTETKAEWTGPREPVQRVGDVEFEGNRIRFVLPPEKFHAFSHQDRAQWIARHVSIVVDHVKLRTDGDIIDIVSRLEPSGSMTLSIADGGNERAARMLAGNVKFATYSRYTPNQDSAIKNMTVAAQSLYPDSKEIFDFEKAREKAFQFSETDILADRLSPGAVRHVTRSLIYQDVARAQAGGGHRTDVEKLEALMDWVFVNVSNHFERAAPDNEFLKDWNDNPLELMLRGMGDCDRSAFVLAVLARHAGLDGQVVYLNRPDPLGRTKFVSFHTISQIRVNHRWLAVDPFSNIIYPKSVADLSLTDEKFRNAFLMMNSVGIRSLLPVMKLAEMICRMYIPDQLMFFDIGNSVRQTVADLAKPGAPEADIEQTTQSILHKISMATTVAIPTFNIYIKGWELPFWLRGYYYADMQRLLKKRHAPFLEILRDVRLKQIVGRYDEAQRLFDSLKQSKHAGVLFPEERDYFSLLNLYYLNDDDTFIPQARDYQNRYPDSPRNSMLNYLLAHSLHREGRRQEAMAVYPRGANFMGRGSVPILGVMGG
ncbi:MAG: hypothetical protein A3G34_02930 [Candidatus Lindowbacteria bacterium RIFCSPLOWO2_12_FULL_62_27]|nr:MAG: hypothetical protein A3G34_02930 [Candidatus Lindowbacteria bacterium RIFCSPLOWO2_12_FULL_62_27]OGH61683.1 MAG: hypothetical protein A3I06_01740 [Candidatus Lindowbacteria bacterium RIFCSPLOWO2_02_FULL_62_12]